MARTQVMQVRVNNVEVSWTDDSKRKPRDCRKCKKPTTGRRDEIGGRSSAWCFECAIADAMSAAIITPRRLKELLEGSN